MRVMKRAMILKMSAAQTPLVTGEVIRKITLTLDCGERGIFRASFREDNPFFRVAMFLRQLDVINVGYTEIMQWKVEDTDIIYYYLTNPMLMVTDKSYKRTVSHSRAVRRGRTDKLKRQEQIVPMKLDQSPITVKDILQPFTPPPVAPCCDPDDRNKF